MSRNKILFFLITTVVLTGLILTFNFIQETNRKEAFYDDADRVLSHIEKNFASLVDSLYAQSYITSEHLSQKTMNTENYGKFAADIIKERDEIFGLNLLNAEGEIVQVYPPEENKSSLHKKTQNFNQLQNSLKLGQGFWLSPPFKLYQGPMGFAIYIPLIQDGKLNGWIASVVSIETFFKKFIKNKYLKNYHLIVKDNASGLNYFETDKLPVETHRFVTETEFIKGRTVTFISWPRVPLTPQLDLIRAMGLGAVCSALITYLLSFYEKKNKSYLPLKEVENLLRVSIQDAASSAVVMQNQLKQVSSGPTPISVERIGQHANYVSGLLDQVKLLHKISNLEESTRLEKVALHSIMKDIETHITKKFNDKKVIFEFNRDHFLDKHVLVNKWLLTNGVFNNILEHALLDSQDEVTLHFSCSTEKSFHQIAIKHEGIQSNVSIERNLSGARRVLTLLRGDLLLENNLHGNFIYIILLPKTS